MRIYQLNALLLHRVITLQVLFIRYFPKKISIVLFNFWFFLDSRSTECSPVEVGPEQPETQPNSICCKLCSKIFSTADEQDIHQQDHFPKCSHKVRNGYCIRCNNPIDWNAMEFAGIVMNRFRPQNRLSNWIHFFLFKQFKIHSRNRFYLVKNDFTNKKPKQNQKMFPISKLNSKKRKKVFTSQIENIYCKFLSTRGGWGVKPEKPHEHVFIVTFCNLY